MARHVVSIFAVSLMVLSASMACAQTYPSKPLRIVTNEAGGNSDFAARLIAQGLTARLRQQAIVDNRPSGIIPGETVAKAPADGYTLLVAGGILWIGPLLQKAPYDPLRDFAPITLAVRAPTVLVVQLSLPVKSVKELIAMAKARPGGLNYASVSSGSITHLAAELFKSMAGVDIMRINYRASGTALTDLIGGQVQLMFPAAGSVAPHIKSGRLRALAVTSAEPSALAPGLPTVAAAGLPGYEALAVNGVLAPRGTPAAVINLLYQEIGRVLTTLEAKEKFLNSGVEPVGSSPMQFAAMIKAETGRMGKVIKDAGIRVE